jgi:integrase
VRRIVTWEICGRRSFAKQEGFLDGENPVKDTKVPGKPQKFRGVAYSLEEFVQLLEDVPDPTASNVITFLAFTGLRQSEARGVRWSDWDVPNRKLYIRRAVWQTKVGGTKNEASEDSIPVLPILQGMLEWRREQVKPNPDDYIFAGKRRGAPKIPQPRKSRHQEGFRKDKNQRRTECRMEGFSRLSPWLGFKLVFAGSESKSDRSPSTTL